MIIKEESLYVAFSELDYEENKIVAKVLEETKKQWENLTNEQLEKIVRGDV